MVLSVLLIAWFERDLRRLRRFLPLISVSAIAVILLEFFGRLVNGSGTTPFGGISRASRAGRTAAVLRWSFKEAGDVFLLVVGIPLLATFILAVGRLRD